MSFLEHLEEFRWVLIKSVLAFLIGCLSIGAFMGDTLTILREPLLKAIDRHGEVGKKLQKAGLGQYTEVFEAKDVGLVDITTVADNNDSDQLMNWGIENPEDQRDGRSLPANSVSLRVLSFSQVHALPAATNPFLAPISRLYSTLRNNSF